MIPQKFNLSTVLIVHFLYCIDYVTILVVFLDNPVNLEMELEKEESGISFWPRRFSDHNNNINTDDVVSNYKNNEKKKIKQNLELNLDPQNCFQVRKNIVDNS